MTVDSKFELMRNSQRRVHRRPGVEEDAFAGAVEALGVLLESGVPPASAWSYLDGDSVPRSLRHVVRSVSAGQSPHEALVSSLHRESGHAVDTLAASWLVAERSGAALVSALRGTAEVLRDRAETLREVDAALSGPRATARLMSVLPFVGILMALGLGIDVVGALLGSPMGWALGIAGSGLLGVGRWWNSRLVRSASSRAPAPNIGLDLTAIALSGGLSVAQSRSLAQEGCVATGLEFDSRALDRVLCVAERAGAPAVELLAATSRQERRSARIEGRRAATALSVQLLLPLGMCVLPSFLLLGVAPVILAMISSTLSGLE